MKKQLSRTVLLITTGALIFSVILSAVLFRQREVQAARSGLKSELALLDTQRQITDAEVLMKQFESSVPDQRLTLIASDGTVLADTVDSVTENHADRPEIKEAKETGEGESIRYSETTGMAMLYVARRFSDGVIGRAAMPLSSIYSLVLQSIVILLVAIAVLVWIVHMIAKRWAEETVTPIEAKQEKLETIRSEFAANVSHELKTPLTSIKGFTDMLSSGMVSDPEDQQRFLTMIGVEVDRLMEMINDLLKLSELESVAMPRPDDRAELLSVCRDVAALLDSAAKRKNIQLTVAGYEAVAGIPPARLRELVMNLVENGIKYTEEGGTVTVIAEQKEQSVLLTVSDTGIGIPSVAQDRIFERFYRVDKGRARSEGGSGLGLAIVKHITQLYGGTIHLESKLGEGTTIVVSLPAAASQ
ncbi:MAG: sensor histidine kinase [Oscillospiraceae bacterium]|jgi:two-component system phosphate regulon sensor histidine kinase PhoR